MATSLVNQYISASFDKVVQISGSQLANGTGTTISSLNLSVTSASYATSAASATTALSATSASYATYAVTSSLPLLGFVEATVQAGSITLTKGDGAETILPISVTGSISSSISSSYAATADELKVVSDNTNNTRYVTFVDVTSGRDNQRADSSFSYNPSTNILTVATVSGNLSGNATTATSASHAVNADNSISSSHSVSALSSSYSNTSTSASHAVQADSSLSATTATSASHALVSDTVSDVNIAYKNVNNTFTGTQTFNTINADSASIGHINYVTGSATIIGDAFVVLNTDSPALRYAGIQVIDSGSLGVTASLQWDSTKDIWLQVEADGTSAGLITGMSGSFGVEAFPTKNTIVKGGGDHQITDSNISDNGSLVKIVSNTEITGSVKTTSTLQTGDTITAPKLVLTGGTGTDLQVTGNATFTSTVQSNVGMQAGLTNTSYLNNQFIGILTNATGDEIGFTADPSGYGVSGWTTGPALYLNDPGDTYPTVIGFQNKASWTDGKVTFLTPISASAGITGDLTGSIEASVIEIGGDFGDGINFYQSGFSQLRFYSGSNKTEVGSWVNLQVNPADGALAISAFPSNAHFVDFEPQTTSSVFTGAVTTNGGLSTTDLTATGASILGNVQATGSLTVTGSATITGTFLAAFPALPNNSEREILTYSSVVDSKGTSYPVARTLMQDYNAPANYDNSFTTEFWDSFSYNYGNEWNVGPRATGGYLQLSGSGTQGLGIFRIRETGTSGVTEGFFYAHNNVVGGNSLNLTSTTNLLLSSSTAQIKSNLTITGSVSSIVTAVNEGPSTYWVMDLNSGSYFDLAIVSGSSVFIQASNTKPGQTFVLRTTQDTAGVGTIAFDNGQFDFAGGTAPTATAETGSVDIYTFVTFNSSTVYGTQVANLKSIP